MEALWVGFRAVTTRIRLADLAALDDGPVVVGGWIETVRDQKKVQFLVLRDESGAVQLVRPRPPEDDAIATAISELAIGSFVLVAGALKHDERVKLGGIEVRIESFDVVGPSEHELPIAPDSSIDKRMDWRFLDLRHPAQQLIFRVQTTFEHALRTWWVEHDFLEVHTPKLMASPSESRAELFQLGYFDTVAYLAQSPQHFKQMAQAAGFGGVFEIADAFRADPSFTARHATEFTSVDMEVSWIDSHEDVMAIHEALLVAGFEAVQAKHGEDIERLFGIQVTVPSRPFPRIPLAEAHRIVEDRGYRIPRTDGDLDPEGERQISAHVKETYDHDFVFVTDYHPEIRPFYHMRPAGRADLTLSFDLLWKGLEVTTGAQREHRYEVLTAQAAEKGMNLEPMAYYINAFRYGCPPHGGFGMGLNRMLMAALGLDSIREATFLFRGPNRLTP